MGILKSFVNNRKYPEGNIISRYGTEEAVEWSMSYLDPDNPIGVPHSRHEGRLDGVGTLGKKSMNPKRKTYDHAHFLVLEHMEVVENMYSSTNSFSCSKILGEVKVGLPKSI